MLIETKSAPTCWSAPVARWSVWRADDGAKSLPDVSFVESSIRRRLSFLAKMALHVAHDCAFDLPSVRLVYATRHGDLSKTTAMLFDLAVEQALSPTAFSMSVPTAVTGAYSISKQDRAPSTALSAAESSFGFGLLEACLQLKANLDAPVLFVYADEPAPAIYQVASGDILTPHAIGLLLVSGAKSQIACKMECADAALGATAQSEAFLRCLVGGEAAVWQGEGRIWSWSRDDRQD